MLLYNVIQNSIYKHSISYKLYVPKFLVQYVSFF